VPLRSGTGTTPLSGAGVAPGALSALSCSSASLIGLESDACTVTLSSPAPSGGLSVSLSSNNAAVTVPATVTVPANATSAAFTANSQWTATTQAVTLSASQDSVTKSFALQLLADTRLLSVSPTTLAFGEVAVNTAEKQSVVLTSTGNLPVTVNAPTLTGTGFSMSGVTFPLTLNPGTTATLSIQFDPSATGAASGQLTITSSNNLTNPTVVVSLSGTGTTATSRALSINATSVAFGNVGLNTPATQSLTLTSTGAEPVTISAATVTGTGFSISGLTFPVTLNPGKTATLTVQFDPNTVGAATGLLTITSNSSTNGTATIGLSGTGVAAQVELSWNAPESTTDPIAGYNIYRSTGSSTSYQLLNSSVDTQTTYGDATVQNGLTYNYIVKSVDDSGVESGPSNMTTVTIP